jgi:DNA-binding MarR family transcriptional regulator
VVRNGDDREFREMISLLYASAARLHGMRRAFAKSLGLSSAEFAVVMATYRLEGAKGPRIRELSDHLHVAAANVTSTVVQLEKAGWVRKVRDPRDSRALGIQLTPAGRSKVKAFSDQLYRLNDVWFAGMDVDELRTVLRFFRRIMRNYPAAAGVAPTLGLPADAPVARAVRATRR